jgi:hypothetical protein
MIPVFPQVVKAPHPTYTRAQISGILDCLSQSTIPSGAVSQISRDTGILQRTLASWRENRLRPNQQDWFPGA